MTESERPVPDKPPETQGPPDDKLPAVARGDITPAEAAHIAERVDARLRATRRLARRAESADRNHHPTPRPQPGRHLGTV